MKQNLLVASILFVAVTSAWATERDNEGHQSSKRGITVSATGAGGAGGDSTALGLGGNAAGGEGGEGGDVSIRNPLQIPPAASANSPNVTIYGCPPVVVGSKAHQNWVFGNSGTLEPRLIAFCAALAVGDIDTARQILCNATPEYRAADLQTGTPQCKVQQD